MRILLRVVLVLSMSIFGLVATPKPDIAEAGHGPGGLNHGVLCKWINTYYVGVSKYQAKACLSVEESANSASVRFRLHTYCYYEGSPTPCNHAANDAVLRWKNCAAGSVCSEGNYGYRDFGTYGSGVPDALALGSWHADTHISYFSLAERVRVRYTNIGYLTPTNFACSLYTEPDGYGDYQVPNCGFL